MQYLPSVEDLLAFYAHSDQQLQAPDWMPCNQKGCCTGDAECCRTALAASITWLEMEAAWSLIRDWPPERRRAAYRRAKTQVEAVRAADPDLIEGLERSSMHPVLAIRQLGEALQSLTDHVCPLLQNDFTCGVYGSRPLVCRAFGHSAIHRAGDAQGTFCGCDHAFKAIQEHPDQEWPNYGGLEHTLLDLAAPRKGVFRSPLIVKPIPFWIVELADESGDLTNPDNIFTRIRDMIEQALANAPSSLPPLGENGEQKADELS